MPDSVERIGLVAGSGSLSSEFVSSAKKRGKHVSVVALSAETKETLSRQADSVVHIPPTQPNKIIRFFSDENVGEIGLVGKVEKSLLFQSVRFDLTVLRFMKNARNMADATIMDAVIEFVEENGMKVMPQTEYLEHLITPRGNITKKKLRQNHRKSSEYAFQMARSVAALDIGQTVVVHKGTVVAVEGIEGTNEAIRRGCALAGKGAVVCKVARPKQDMRYDIPTVGPETLQVMREGGASALILEAGRTFLIDRERLIREAEATGICVVGWLKNELE
ncbi:MAG: UDP-2,3-diacylglucosamine diphosphatase LpxI [Nitrospinae bacterium]|nr:UDP-2,3-diacylglucosamine diphosphatase LpxI [Nitrospinota bacterium]